MALTVKNKDGASNFKGSNVSLEETDLEIGVNGVGIADLKKSEVTTDGGVNRYRLILTDKREFQLNIRNGNKGTDADIAGAEEAKNAANQAAESANRIVSEAVASVQSINQDENQRKANENARIASEDARNQSENTRNNNEQLRINRENTRGTSENTRLQNERNRQNAESTRQSSETTRNNQEATRQSQETTRQGNETTRQQNEEDRQTNETTRGNNETARISSETGRVNAETGRVNAENERVDSEDQREQNENTRQSNETTRQSNESVRQSNENQRQQTFETSQTQRQAAYTQAETNRNNLYTTEEGKRNQAFEDKEAIRDAANQAALDCADTLAQLGPEIDNVGGTTYTEGYAVSNNGELVENSSWGASNYIPYTQGSDVEWNFGGSDSSVVYLCCYDSSKTFISGAYWTAKKSSTTGIRTIASAQIAQYAANAAYIRVSFRLNNEDAKVKIDEDVAWIPTSSEDGLKQRVERLEELDGTSVKITDIANDFNGGTQKVLSAEKGKELNTALSGIEDALNREGSSNYTTDKSIYKDGTLQDAEGWGATDFIPYTQGNDVVWNFGGSNSSVNYVVFYDSSKNAISTAYWTCQGTDGVRTLTSSQIAQYAANGAYLRASFRLTNESASVSIGGSEVWTPTSIAPGIVGQVADLNTEVASHEQRIAALEEDAPQDAGIVSLNDPADTLLRFQHIKKPICNSSGTDTGLRQLTLLHFSDVHGKGDNIQNIIDYYKAYQSYIDDVLHSGDMAANKFSDDFTFWSGKTDAAKFLNAIGNHDTADYSSGYSWYAHVGIDSYNKYFAPFISQWNVTQPSNAATEGKCYYYKDYATSNVRLIVLDCMAIAQSGGDAEQIAWFESVLADAITQGLHVVGVYHYSLIDTAIPCAMQNVYKTALPTTMPTSLMNIVDDFIEDGGNFVCWLGGHTHCDFFGTYTTTHGHKVASVVVDKAGGDTSGYSDMLRTQGTRGYDLFNVFSVDTYRKRFSVFRVGANFDSALRHIGCITYDYDNQVLMANW